MLTVTNMKIAGMDAAIRGMRNPMNSWKKSDSKYCCDAESDCNDCGYGKVNSLPCPTGNPLVVGCNDLDLMKRLFKAGTDHSKFMRMVSVWCDITAPLYWWKEFDTYKVGTVANSCSTMHKIAAKEFTLDDFSHEHLSDFSSHPENVQDPLTILSLTIKTLNSCRECYIKEKDNFFWWQLIQLLPSSYNQKRTVMLNYQVAAKIIRERANHKLSEWHTLVNELKNLPYMREITSTVDNR